MKNMLQLCGLLLLAGGIVSPLGLVWYFFSWEIAIALGLLVYVPAVLGIRNKTRQNLALQTMVDPGYRDLPYNIHHKE